MEVYNNKYYIINNRFKNRNHKETDKTDSLNDSNKYNSIISDKIKRTRNKIDNKIRNKYINRSQDDINLLKIKMNIDLLNNKMNQINNVFSKINSSSNILSENRRIKRRNNSMIIEDKNLNCLKYELDNIKSLRNNYKHKKNKKYIIDIDNYDDEYNNNLNLNLIEKNKDIYYNNYIKNKNKSKKNIISNREINNKEYNNIYGNIISPKNNKLNSNYINNQNSSGLMQYNLKMTQYYFSINSNNYNKIINNTNKNNDLDNACFGAYDNFFLETSLNNKNIEQNINNIYIPTISNEKEEIKNNCEIQNKMININFGNKENIKDKIINSNNNKINLKKNINNKNLDNTITNNKNEEIKNNNADLNIKIDENKKDINQQNENIILNKNDNDLANKKNSPKSSLLNSLINSNKKNHNKIENQNNINNNAITQNEEHKINSEKKINVNTKVKDSFNYNKKELKKDQKNIVIEKSNNKSNNKSPKNLEKKNTNKKTINKKNIFPQKRKKNVSIHEEDNISIEYNYKDEITNISVFDFFGSKKDFKPRNINVIIEKLKRGKINSILLNKDAKDNLVKLPKTDKNDGKTKKLKKSSSSKLITSNKELLNKYNLKKEKPIYKKITNNKIIHKTKKVCEKFKNNPQFFYTENLCNLVIKSLDLDKNGEDKENNKIINNKNKDNNNKNIKTNYNPKNNYINYENENIEMEIDPFNSLQKIIEESDEEKDKNST